MAGPGRIDTRRAWREARDLIRRHRRSLAAGLALMLVSRLAGLVLPARVVVGVEEGLVSAPGVETV